MPTSSLPDEYRYLYGVVRSEADGLLDLWTERTAELRDMGNVVRPLVDGLRISADKLEIAANRAEARAGEGQGTTKGARAAAKRAQVLEASEGLWEGDDVLEMVRKEENAIFNAVSATLGRWEKLIFPAAPAAQERYPNVLLKAELPSYAYTLTTDPWRLSALSRFVATERKGSKAAEDGHEVSPLRVFCLRG